MEQQRKKTFYIYGDSNTYGYNPLASCYEEDRLPEEIRWPVILKKHWASSMNIIEDGCNGRCLPMGEASLARFRQTVERYEKLDFFAVMLGTNDILNQSSPDPAEIAENMDQLLEIIKSIHAGCTCIVVTPPRMEFPPGHPMHRYQVTNEELRDWYRKIAQKYAAGFVDAGQWDIDLFSDGIHLSENGNQQFAEYMMQALTSVFYF